MSFAYHASAVGLGGILDTGVVPSQASVALAPDGGEGHAYIDDYTGPGQVSVAHAETHVTGTRRGMQYETTTEVFLRGLDVVGRLQVTSMHAKMKSTRLVTPANIEIDSFFELEASIVGLWINGENVAPVLDISLYSNHSRFDHFVNHVAGNIGPYKNRFGWTDDEELAVSSLSADLQAPTAAGAPHPVTRVMNPIRSSFLDSIRPDLETPGNPVMRRRGYKLEVPRFGQVKLAEVLLKPGRRRINMLRIDLDSRYVLRNEDENGRGSAARDDDGPAATSSSYSLAGSGTLSIASIEGNGAPTYP
jgi:hypothetical protein